MQTLGYCNIEWTTFGSRIVFPDGTEVSAWPHWDDHHYHVIAHRCGYGDDLLAYCREHELAHVVVAEAFWGGASYALWYEAHKAKPLNKGMVLMEEVAAQTLQHWTRGNVMPIVADYDWDKLKRDFLHYVKELELEYYTVYGHNRE